VARKLAANAGVGLLKVTRDSGGIDYFLKADFPLPIRVDE